VKRSLDLIISMILLIFFGPVFIIVALMIYIVLGPPMLFIQTRPGLNGRPFEIIKFRTMMEIIHQNDNSLSDEKRLTAFGEFLRSTSIDEIPELWNVIKGDMSLVGPRPLLMEYLPLYSKEQNRRHEVRPGITGQAQINGRNAISWEKKFALDVWYVDNQSFWLDLGILFQTLKKVFLREGISAEGEATMPRFTGTPK
jgi:lipopolysaccharide/colanic/teichoic acid biosynthesis glycosyltransferase